MGAAFGMSQGRWICGGLLIGMLTCAAAVAGQSDLSGAVAVEWRWFFDDPALAGQLEQDQASGVLEPEWEWRSEDRRHQFRVRPFYRLDAEDAERTHFDLREAFWRYVGDDWDLVVGANKVFWGVTESRHLVDVVNQTDTVEDIDEEDKLGQPMINAGFQRDWGRIDLFVLPGFRRRTFVGDEGRFRFSLPVDEQLDRYESSAEDGRIDGAVRYSHYVGDFDIGAHLFHGTSREPRFVLPGPNNPVPNRIAPFYDVMTQVGFDGQYTREAWLWKLEVIGRDVADESFAAAVGGFEYTFYQVGGGAADLGVLLEYLWDDRDDDPTRVAPTAFENDVFVGGRFAWNDIQDTSLLFGAIVDADDGSTSGLVEFARRLGSRITVEAEARFLAGVDQDNLLAAFEDDSFLNLRLAYNF